nr:cytochrome c oxidase subunit 4 [Georgenia faecalis]
MRVETLLFAAGPVFFVPVGIVYGFLSDWESVGTTAFFLLAGLYSLAGGYLWMLSKRVDPRPEDDPLANVEDNAGEMGVYAPHSWWPLVLGVAAMLVFLGPAVDAWWMLGVGVVVGVVGLVGQLFEFSRGQHAH